MSVDLIDVANSQCVKIFKICIPFLISSSANIISNVDFPQRRTPEITLIIFWSFRLCSCCMYCLRYIKSCFCILFLFELIALISRWSFPSINSILLFPVQRYGFYFSCTFIFINTLSAKPTAHHTHLRIYTFPHSNVGSTWSPTSV